MLSSRPAAGRLLCGSRSNALRIPAVCIPQPVAIHTNSKHQCVQTVRATAATAQTAPSSTAAPTTVRQQLPQRQQKSRNSSRTRNSSGTTIRRPQKPKPFLVRIAGRTSDIKAASGAVVKRLRTEDMVRVAAIDPDSLTKALITLTAANNMAQANSGHMLVFQPTAITAAAAEPPRIPKGSMVMYTSQIMQGEIMTFNTLRVTATTADTALSKAVIARIATSSHTVLECYGTTALTVAVRAVAQARKGLLVRGQDVACIITSTPKSMDFNNDTAADSSSDGSVAADSAAESSSSSSSRLVTCHRLVVLECEPRNPRALLVTSTVGVSDRAAGGKR